ncbi:MAG TPA: hypothetical protein PLE74_05355 [Candidatus Cloacimonadota bacterium]|nr:hypothetical protein [Candidatus Cloacimonadota bacterium]HPT71688.1 hypothetical protein [Candidatus Cloacimonadota bacterium]
MNEKETNITEQLSSQVGDTTQASNEKVAEEVRKQPKLLEDIVKALKSKDSKLAGDAAEVITMVAQKAPELVEKYAKALIEQIDHKTTRVRWEVMHALSLIADRVPREIDKVYHKLEEIMKSDKSIIVRDYVTDLFGKYASVGKKEAEKAFKTLKENLHQWEERHASRVMEGLMVVYRSWPDSKAELQQIAAKYSESTKATIKKTAKKLAKELKIKN